MGVRATPEQVHRYVCLARKKKGLSNYNVKKDYTQPTARFGNHPTIPEGIHACIGGTK